MLTENAYSANVYALRLPMKVLANAVLRMLDYEDMCHTLVPEVAENDRYALPLTAMSLYEIFRRPDKTRTSNCKFMVGVENRESAEKASKRELIGEIFNLEKIDSTCAKQHLVFRNRSLSKPVRHFKGC